MNVDVTKLPESRIALKIELSAAEVDQAFDRTYKKLVQRFNVPGFRRGKAPRPVVERMIGHEYFVHEATEEAVQWGFQRAVRQEQIVPLDQAEIQEPEGEDHHHLEPGQGFTFEARVAVKPEVQLPDYHGMRVERRQEDVTDEAVDTLLSDLRERNVTLEPTIRTAEVGDVVTINITAQADGVEVLQQDNADYEVQDEAGGEPDPVLPGLSLALVGASRGDIKEFPVPLPSAYPANPDLSGKTLQVRILVKEIKRKVLPALDDEFVQSISDLQTVAELRERLRENLEIERRAEADERLVTDAIEQVAERTFVELPPVLIEEEIDRMLAEMRRSFEDAHVPFETYLESTGHSEAELRAQMREAATRNVKTSLVVGAIADGEGVDITNDEVNSTLEELVRAANIDAAERRRLRSSNAVRSNIRSRIRRQRAIQQLVQIMSGGEEVSSEVAGVIADQTAAPDDKTEESVAVEAAG